MPGPCLGMHPRRQGRPPEPTSPLAPDFAAGLVDQLERALMTSTCLADQQLRAALQRWRDGDLT